MSPGFGRCWPSFWAKVPPNMRHHCRTLSWLTVMPRSERMLHVAQAQAEDMAEPDGVAHDLGRGAVSEVGAGLGRRLAILAQPPSFRPETTKLTMPALTPLTETERWRPAAGGWWWRTASVEAAPRRLPPRRQLPFGRHSSLRLNPGCPPAYGGLECRSRLGGGGCGSVALAAPRCRHSASRMTAPGRRP
jgi:hypothetical protein